MFQPEEVSYDIIEKIDALAAEYHSSQGSRVFSSFQGTACTQGTHIPSMG
jgi:hypothetical protein